MRGYPFGFIGVGTPGATILSGSGAPSGSLGRDNDFYIDTDVYDIYGPKTAGAWGAPTSLGGGGGGGLPPGGSTGDFLKLGMFGVPGWSSEGLIPEGSVAGAFLRQYSSTPYLCDWVLINQVPGFDELTDQGKILTINGSVYEWLAGPAPLPTTTNAGWVLTQQSATPGDIDWSAAQEGLPSYSSPADDGKFVKLIAGIPDWAAILEVPVPASPADDGKVLTANGGDYAWEDPTGGTGLTYRQTLSAVRRS